MRPKFFDQAEDVVPPAAVESGGVFAQLVEYLLRFEGAEDGLDQHGGPDGAARQVELFLGEEKDVVPEPGLEVTLELGQIEIGAGPVREQGGGVVEEKEAEIEEARRHRRALETDVFFREVPAARAHHQRRGLLLQTVQLPLAGGESDLPADRVEEVGLPRNEILPRG